MNMAVLAQLMIKIPLLEVSLGLKLLVFVFRGPEQALIVPQLSYNIIRVEVFLSQIMD